MIDYTVLACLINNNELAAAVEVEKHHFENAMTQTMFEAVMEALVTGGAVDIPLLAAYLSHQHGHLTWTTHLERLVDEIAPAANFAIYQQKLKEAYVKRSAREIGAELAKQGDVAPALEALKSLTTASQQRGQSLDTLARDFVAELENPVESIKTGVKVLDSRFGGFHKSDLIVVGARPSMGKTAFAVNLALGSGEPFVFFSGEQGANQLMQRMVSIQGGVPLWRMRNNSLDDDDHRNIANTLKQLRERDAYIVDIPAPSLQDIVTESRRQHQQRGIRLVVVDYLQRMRVVGDSRREGIEAAVRGLKELARELDIPVVVLAQVNRRVDERPVKHPSMGDLMESGAIEAEADQIIMLSRKVVYEPDCPEKNEAQFTVAKHRHGPHGKFTLHFQADVLRFEEAA
jgi:replicative DNA helicase